MKIFFIIKCLGVGLLLITPLSCRARVQQGSGYKGVDQTARVMASENATALTALNNESVKTNHIGEISIEGRVRVSDSLLIDGTNILDLIAFASPTNLVVERLKVEFNLEGSPVTAMEVRDDYAFIGPPLELSSSLIIDGTNILDLIASSSGVPLNYPAVSNAAMNAMAKTVGSEGIYGFNGFTSTVSQTSSEFRVQNWLDDSDRIFSHVKSDTTESQIYYNNPPLGSGLVQVDADGVFIEGYQGGVQIDTTNGDIELNPSGGSLLVNGTNILNLIAAAEPGNYAAVSNAAMNAMAKTVGSEGIYGFNGFTSTVTQASAEFRVQNWLDDSDRIFSHVKSDTTESQIYYNNPPLGSGLVQVDADGVFIEGYQGDVVVDAVNGDFTADGREFKLEATNADGNHIIRSIYQGMLLSTDGQIELAADWGVNVTGDGLYKNAIEIDNRSEADVRYFNNDGSESNLVVGSVITFADFPGVSFGVSNNAGDVVFYFDDGE